MTEEICKMIQYIRKNDCYKGENGDKKWKGKKKIKDLKDEYTNEIEFFINNDELRRFDFSNDCDNDDYRKIDNQDNPINKYLWYRASGLSLKNDTPYEKAKNFKESSKREGKCSGMIDPDSESILLQLFYKVLYGEEFCKNDLFINCENNKKDKSIQGDTMNTVQSALNSYIEQCLEPYLEQKVNIKDIRKKSGNTYYPVSFAYFLELYCQDQDKEIDIGITDRLEEINAAKLMKTYHTLGNFIIIPTGCNAPRGSCILKDFWDLTLACIYNWYSQKEKREDRIFKEIDGKRFEYNIRMIFTEESSLIKYVKWLNLFGTWDNFVKDNYLGDSDDVKNENKIIENFVEKKKGDKQYKYGRPRELWPGHFKGEVMPKNTEEYKDFFTNSSKYIENRGFIMHEELKKIMAKQIYADRCTHGI